MSELPWLLVYGPFVWPAVLALGVLGGRLGDPEDAPFRPVYASMSLFVAAVVWFNVISGVVIASYRAV